MKTYITILSLLVVCLCGCSKDSNTSNANSANSVGTGGSLAKFIIVGNYLYIADVTAVKVYDISNNGAPAEKEPVPAAWGIETIFSYDNNLFLGASNGMYVYSLADPSKPALIGQAQHFRSCDPVVANDSFAFVTLRGNERCGPAVDGLYTYNIQDVTNPVLLYTLEMSTPSGLALNGKLVYVCRQDNGMSIVDVTNASNPMIKKTLTDAVFEDVIVYDKLLICYVSTGLRLYDISTPENPVYINTVLNE